MAEHISKLKETIRELEAELESLDSIDQETRAVLESALAEISETLRRRDSGAETHEEPQSLATKLQEAAEGFESSHPTLFGIVGRTVNALGQMGI
jgi:predicted RNase H-like nuclease (RuvC/YqgF family)